MTHYCPDWDYLQIKSGDPEMECCTCEAKMNVGQEIVCRVCGKVKRPKGRSVPLELEDSLCGQLDSDLNEVCLGYRQPPYPSSLWPGEESEVMS